MAIANLFYSTVASTSSNEACSSASIVPPHEKQKLFDIFPDMDPEFLNSLQYDQSPDWMSETVASLSENGFPRLLMVEGAGSRDEIIDHQYQTLLTMFPYLDPNFLMDKCKQMSGNKIKMEEFITEELEINSKRVKERETGKKEDKGKKKIVVEKFNIEKFLQVLPDPLQYFLHEKKNSKDSYSLGMSYLQKRYDYLLEADIVKTFKWNEYNLTRTCEVLDKTTSSETEDLRCDLSDLKDLNPSIMQEITFIENKTTIIGYRESVALAREEAFKEAKESGAILECPCCYNPELLLEDMACCIDGHLFCKECIVRGAEARIGEGRTTFPCLVECSEEFSLRTLQEVLKPSVFSHVLHSKQLEEVKMANIQGLEFCPFCDFAMIPNVDDSVFHCLSNECMKDSCRNCKEESHVPYRCNEIETDVDVKMRTYVEDKMTEALIRTCWKCSRKFIKQDGCNKISCPCGSLMCYICQKPIRDYTHFYDAGQTIKYGMCPLYSNNVELHVNVVQNQGLKAKEEILLQNPGKELKNDPTKIPPSTSGFI